MVNTTRRPDEIEASVYLNSANLAALQVLEINEPKEVEFELWVGSQLNEGQLRRARTYRDAQLTVKSVRQVVGLPSADALDVLTGAAGPRGPSNVKLFVTAEMRPTNSQKPLLAATGIVGLVAVLTSLGVAASVVAWKFTAADVKTSLVGFVVLAAILFFVLRRK
jgi:hypothetical protein